MQNKFSFFTIPLIDALSPPPFSNTILFFHLIFLWWQGWGYRLGEILGIRWYDIIGGGRTRGALGEAASLPAILRGIPAAALPWSTLLPEAVWWRAMVTFGGVAVLFGGATLWTFGTPDNTVQGGGTGNVALKLLIG